MLLQYKTVIEKQENWLIGVSTDNTRISYVDFEHPKSHLHSIPDNILNKVNQICHKEGKNVIATLSNLKPESIEDYFRSKNEYVNCVTEVKKSNYNLV